MQFFAWTASTGWLAVVLLASGVSIPYLSRRSLRLWPHYWLGILIPAGAIWHASIPMSAGHVDGYDQAGLWLATLALVVMFWQVGLGLTLRVTKGPERCGLRRVHFWTMIGLVVLVVLHIVRNRP
ncbi:MAG: hypothetical protein ABSD74_12030 [Rhizomicrobium sp.]|jgi:hypothetical protein